MKKLILTLICCSVIWLCNYGQGVEVRLKSDDFKEEFVLNSEDWVYYQDREWINKYSCTFLSGGWKFKATGKYGDWDLTIEFEPTFINATFKKGKKEKTLRYRPSRLFPNAEDQAIYEAFVPQIFPANVEVTKVDWDKRMAQLKVEYYCMHDGEEKTGVILYNADDIENCTLSTIEISKGGYYDKDKKQCYVTVPLPQSTKDLKCLFKYGIKGAALLHINITEQLKKAPRGVLAGAGGTENNEEAGPQKIQPVKNTSGNTLAAPKVETLTAKGVLFKMVKVEGGTFMYRDTQRKQMGSYYIGQTEVTQALWQAVMGTNPSIRKGKKLPVDNITYWQALSFCQRLSQLTGRKFRLPTDAEWEYAAKGGRYGKGYLYAGSDNRNEVGWFEENSSGPSVKDMQPVGQKKNNELGIYDMSGNAAEMCSDYIDHNHPESEKLPGAYRRARGGSVRIHTTVGGKEYDVLDFYSQGFGTYATGMRLLMEDK